TGLQSARDACTKQRNTHVFGRGARQVTRRRKRELLEDGEDGPGRGQLHVDRALYAGAFDAHPAMAAREPCQRSRCRLADRRLAADERRDQRVRRRAGRKPLQYERDPAAAGHVLSFVEQDGLERTLDPGAERGQRAHRFQRGLAVLELFDQRSDELGGPELAGGGYRRATHDEIRVPQEGEEGAEESTYSDPA